MSARSDDSFHPTHALRSRRAIRRLLVLALLALLCGCPTADDGPSPPPEPPKPAAPLRVIVVDDAPLAAAIDREWRARAETALKVLQKTTDDILDKRLHRLAADAIIYPSGLIGELAERDLIVPVPEEVVNDSGVDEDDSKRPRLDRRDMFELIRQRDIVWGERVYAVPLGSPTFVLFYRRDLFDAVGASPPASWAAYQQLAIQLSRRENLGESAPPVGEPWYGTVEPLGPGWAGQTLLARASVYARHRNYLSVLFDLYTMDPLISAPPFVRALEELAAAAKLGPAEAIRYTPADARRELLAGHCAMALTWPSRAQSSGATDQPSQREPFPVGVAELPPSKDVYEPDDAEWRRREESETGHVTLLDIAGRLGSVSRSSRRPQAALDLLLRLSGTEWSTAISPQSADTTLYRTSQMPSASAWIDAGFQPAVGRDYAEVLRQALRRRLWMGSLRIPGRPRYLEALDEAVHRAIQGDASPAECLEAVAERWRAITDELGVESQQAAYWKSLGMEP